MNALLQELFLWKARSAGLHRAGPSHQPLSTFPRGAEGAPGQHGGAELPLSAVLDSRRAVELSEPGAAQRHRGGPQRRDAGRPAVLLSAGAVSADRHHRPVHHGRQPGDAQLGPGRARRHLRRLPRGREGELEAGAAVQPHLRCASAAGVHLRELLLRHAPGLAAVLPAAGGDADRRAAVEPERPADAGADRELPPALHRRGAQRCADDTGGAPEGHRREARHTGDSGDPPAADAVRSGGNALGGSGSAGAVRNLLSELQPADPRQLFQRLLREVPEREDRGRGREHRPAR